ncbi:unnamed protein product [Bathycoccus prasinos]
MATTETDRMTIKTHHYDQLSKEEQKLLLKRPRVDFTSIASIVDPIVNKVRDEGDSAVLEFTEKFDKVRPSPLVEKIENFPQPSLDPTVKEAFDVAFENIKKFHEAQLNTGEVDVTTMPGVRCRRVARPIGSVGLYVPGGTAVLPSTALMLAVPAMIAKCPIVVLATPPLKDGTICPEVLYCAKKSGVTHILKAGGAQAVAAMGYGTETCPKVDKIFGPGNQFVTAAKMNLQNSDAMCAIDMPAGPSEVLVVADKDANPSHVAADLLSQAEHGPDSQVVLVVTPDVNVERIVEEVRVQANKLPRADITEKALRHSYCVVVKDIDEVVKFSNAYAPEHLIVNVEDPESLLPSLDNAGSIFMGRYTPESVGDYASGTNHVLPTYGFSRMYSGVSLDSFIKYMTVQELTKEGIENLGPHVAKMAEVEGLDAHRLAVTLRLGIEFTSKNTQSTMLLSGEGVVTRARKRKVGERDSLWDLVVKNDDISLTHIIPRLNATDVKFLYDVNSETRKLIKRSSRADDLKRKDVVDIDVGVCLEHKSLWSGCLTDQTHFCWRVAATNKLELLKWAREEKKCKWDKWTINVAAVQGNLEMAKYCVVNECPIDEWTCAYAAENGHLECLKYLHEEVKAPWDSDTANCAAHSGQLHILEYLVERKYDQYSEYACMYAAEKGHLDCLRYLHETAKAPWDEEAVRYAHKYNQTDCVQYLVDNDCPLPHGWRYERGELYAS